MEKTFDGDPTDSDSKEGCQEGNAIDQVKLDGGLDPSSRNSERLLMNELIEVLLEWPIFWNCLSVLT